MHYLRLYRRLLHQQFRVMLQYRADFLIGAGAQLAFQAAAVAALWVAMGSASNLNGWTYDELLLIQGVLALSRSLNQMFAASLWGLGSEQIRTGRFDRFLLRPINPLFHLLAARFGQDGVGTLAAGAALTIMASTGIGIRWSLLNLAYLALAVASGGAIFIAINLMTSVIGFWVVNSFEVMVAVHELQELAKFPLSIYPRAIGALLTWVLPYGLASFYPAGHLLGRSMGALAWVGPVMAGLLLVIAYQVWRLGLRHYTSTGS